MLRVRRGQELAGQGGRDPPTLIEAIGDWRLVGDQPDGEEGRVEHIPHLEPRPLVCGDELESHDLLPPPGAALHVGDGQVYVPEAVDRREFHREQRARETLTALGRTSKNPGADAPYVPACCPGST